MLEIAMMELIEQVEQSQLTVVEHVKVKKLVGFCAKCGGVVIIVGRIDEKTGYIVWDGRNARVARSEIRSES